MVDLLRENAKRLYAAAAVGSHRDSAQRAAVCITTPRWSTDIAFFKCEGFTLWSIDDEGHDATVVPTHPHGSGKTDLQRHPHRAWLELHRLHQSAQARARDSFSRRTIHSTRTPPNRRSRTRSTCGNLRASASVSSLLRARSSSWFFIFSLFVSLLVPRRSGFDGFTLRPGWGGKQAMKTGPASHRARQQ
jgi:hypothetical protein